MNLKIFFSHAWNDKAGSKVKRLLNFLQTDYDVWLDKVQITPGDHINQTVANGIAQCNLFVNVWSSNAHKSAGVQFELQEAAKLQKPMLVLLIEDYPISESPLLDGREYLDFSGDEVSFRQQLVYLQNFLLQKKIELFEENVTTPQDIRDLAAIKEQHRTLYQTLIELEDTLKRQRMNESGNDHSHVYVESSLNAFEKTLDKNSEEGSLMMQFSKAMKALSEKYPLKEDDALKKKLAIEAIEQLDPGATNPQLAALKAAFANDLSPKQQGESKPPTTQVDIVKLQHADKQLIEAYKLSVEKTRQHVLSKTKSSLDSIPIFKFISSLSTASTDFEMQYITNSPATLEKMYETAVASNDKELQSLVAILIRYLKPEELDKAEASQKINSFMHYAYLINNTARLLVQAGAFTATDVSYNLISSIGIDKLSTFFFAGDWKDKAEKFLELVKNNYGIEDKNLNWLKTAATIVGVILVADALGDAGDIGDASAVSADAGAGGPVYFEDKMAAMGFSVPNTVQW